MRSPGPVIARRIETYLEQVSAVLRKEKISAEDIESVCDGLHEQILDMAGQSGPVDEARVVRAIDSMEDPVSFAVSVHTEANQHGGPPGEPQRNEVMRLVASIGFYLAISGPALALMLGMIVGTIEGGGMEFGSFILFAAAIVALIFGVIARQEARGRVAIWVSIGTIAGYFLLFSVALLLG